MDLYRGRPGHFHLQGMSGTPKEGENLETLQSFAETLSICFVRMIQGLGLRRFVEADPVIGSWYKRATATETASATSALIGSPPDASFCE
jgi:hypothetical protein